MRPQPLPLGPLESNTVVEITGAPQHVKGLVEGGAIYKQSAVTVVGGVPTRDDPHPPPVKWGAPCRPVCQYRATTTQTVQRRRTPGTAARCWCVRDSYNTNTQRQGMRNLMQQDYAETPTRQGGGKGGVGCVGRRAARNCTHNQGEPRPRQPRRARAQSSTRRKASQLSKGGGARPTVVDGVGRLSTAVRGVAGCVAPHQVEGGPLQVVAVARDRRLATVKRPSGRCAGGGGRGDGGVSLWGGHAWVQVHWGGSRRVGAGEARGQAGLGAEVPGTPPR